MDHASHDDHHRRLACDLAMGTAAGPSLVVGRPPLAVLLGLGQVTSHLVAVDGGPGVEDAWEALEPWTPAEIACVPPEGGLPEVEGGFGSLLLWDLSDDDALTVVEAALGCLADGAPLVVSSAWPEAGLQGRLERLLEGSCGAPPVRPVHAPLDRWVLSGERRAPAWTDRVLETGGTLPLSVVVVAEGDRSGTEGLLLDVLLRQAYPPSEVLVVDRLGSDEIPDDLFGFPARSGCRTVLARCLGMPLADAVNDALGAVAHPFVALLRAGDRLSPNALASLAMTLEDVEAAVAVVGQASHLTAGGGVDALIPLPPGAIRFPRRHLLSGGGLPWAATVIRTETLRAVGGLDPATGEAAFEDLWCRVIRVGPLAEHPAPVAGCARLPPHLSGDVLERFLGAEPIAGLMRELPDVPRDERDAFARRLRVEAALHGGATEAAREQLAAWAETFGEDRESPVLDLELLVLWYERRSRDLLREADVARNAGLVSRSVGVLAYASALAALGRWEEARRELGAFLAVAQSDAVVLKLASLGPDGRSLASWIRARGVRHIPDGLWLARPPRPELDPDEEDPQTGC